MNIEIIYWRLISYDYIFAKSLLPDIILHKPHKSKNEYGNRI